MTIARPLRKAVFPVAGLGTRFLPATKASPKEMMPVVDKPLIQYAVEEAAAAGITDMVFITGRNKRAIEDHFDKAYEMESELSAKGKQDLVDVIQQVLPRGCRCIYIRQSEPLGLGHAVLCAQPAIGDEAFAVILADDLIAANPPVMAQMAALYQREQCAVLGVEDVPADKTASYGIVSPEESGSGLTPIKAIIEKPAPDAAPSTLAVVGRYVLTPGIFKHLAAAKPGRGGEIQLTDGISALLAEERVLAYRFLGERFDCGSKLGYLKATVELGMRHPEVGAEFAAYLKRQK
ncbi:MAG: UTP--glucose-1-phosphate uridylyltransferase GalU [Alphaproteobacteria bacterium]|nr:UTP--glucose-1-phosphate uridylyltransferase GalU [Alphaproteobacteria bacterium]